MNKTENVPERSALAGLIEPKCVVSRRKPLGRRTMPQHWNATAEQLWKLDAADLEVLGRLLVALSRSDRDALAQVTDGQDVLNDMRSRFDETVLNTLGQAAPR